MIAATAFHGDPAIKAYLLARIDAHLAAGSMLFEGTAWKDGRGSALGISIAGTDPVAYAEAFGYPVALAALLDSLTAFPTETFDASGFVRDWVDAVTPGANLRRMPTLLILEMLDAPELRGRYDDLLTEIVALHLRDLTDNHPGRPEWARTRAAVLALPREDEKARGAVSMLEAACWTATSGRSVLVENLVAWRRLTVLEDDPDWSDADERHKETTLKTLWVEQHDVRAAGDTPDYPALFGDRDPDLSARFVAHLARTNRRHGERNAEVATWCIALMRAAKPISDDRTIMMSNDR